MHVLRSYTRFLCSLILSLPFLLIFSSAPQADVYFNQALVRVSWSPSQEADTKGYEVHRATASAGPYARVSGSLITTTSWSDTTVSGGTYYYKVKAMDTCGNLSGLSPVSDVAVIDLVSPSVSASPAAGTYSQSISVTLQASENAVIHYTRDGSTPTRSSATYSSPLLLTGTTTLKYFAVDRAQNESAVATSRYTINVSSDDYDGDGYSNSLETSMGTDPNDSASRPKAASLTLAPADGPIAIDSTLQLSVLGTFKPATGDPVEYNLTGLVQYASDSSNVTVSGSGLATGKSAGTANIVAKQILDGTTVATSNQIRVTVDGAPPVAELLETRPYNNQGTSGDTGPTPRIPIDTGVIVRVLDSPVGDNIGIDEGSIQLSINGQAVSAKVHEVVPGDLHALDIAYQNTKPFQFGQVVSVKLDASDMAGNKVSFTESFQVETQLQHQAAQALTPPQSTASLGDGTFEVAVMPAADAVSDEALDGAAIIYHEYEPVKPRVGPVDEIPALDIAVPVGIPLNLEPATVFDGPVTVVLPVPDAQLRDTDANGIPDAGLEAYDVYQFMPHPNVLWRASDEATGWLVEGSREDRYDTDPPTIEVQVTQACAVQVGASGTQPGPTPDVKVNEQDGSILCSASDKVTVTITLEPGNVEQNVDWWILAETPKGWYHLDVESQKWKKGQLPSVQAVPSAITAQRVYAGSPPFGPGTYRIHFGLDDNADGQWDQVWQDSVQVYVFR